jgi:hypothetical protein
VGHQTAGVVSGPIALAHNLSQGFELWDDGIAHERLAHDDVTNPAMEMALDRFIDEQRDPARPFFLLPTSGIRTTTTCRPRRTTRSSWDRMRWIDVRRYETNPAIRLDMPPAQLAYVLAVAGEIR